MSRALTTDELKDRLTVALRERGFVGPGFAVDVLEDGTRVITFMLVNAELDAEALWRANVQIFCEPRQAAMPVEVELRTRRLKHPVRRHFVYELQDALAAVSSAAATREVVLEERIESGDERRWVIKVLEQVHLSILEDSFDASFLDRIASELDALNQLSSHRGGAPAAQCRPAPEAR